MWLKLRDPFALSSLSPRTSIQFLSLSGTEGELENLAVRRVPFKAPPPQLKTTNIRMHLTDATYVTHRHISSAQYQHPRPRHGYMEPQQSSSLSSGRRAPLSPGPVGALDISPSHAKARAEILHRTLRTSPRQAQHRQTSY